MTFDEIREIGLKLPDAEETRYYRMPALKVNEEVFVVQTSHPSAEPNSISVPIGFERREKLIATNPGVYYLKPHYKPYPVVLVRLDRIERSELKRLLRSAHEAVASGAVVPGRRRESPSKKKR
jgi:hypothetical protein